MLLAARVFHVQIRFRRQWLRNYGMTWLAPVELSPAFSEALPHHHRAHYNSRVQQTWRWFGTQDPVSLDHIKQAGATGIVTALHHIYGGEAWPINEVLKRRAQIEAAGLTWSVVESIPIHNSIKLRRGPFHHFTDAWKDSLRAIAQAGIKVVCYNFMPVLDWTRTDLRWQLSSTGYTLRFDVTDFAAYDLFLLRRPRAEHDYPEDRIASARTRYNQMSPARRDELEQTIVAGLPGGEGSYDRASLQTLIAEYQGMKPGDLRANLISFLTEVVPVAEELGMRLAIHPDDPPWSLFGLPRVVSTAQDARAILAGVDSEANGLTFCVGSYGAGAVGSDAESQAIRLRIDTCQDRTRILGG